MTTRKARSALRRIHEAQPETEAGWQAVVVQYAIMRHWRIYHTFDSRHSHVGYPDLTLCRDSRLVFAELKAAKGKVTVDQLAWLDALACTGAETYLWRPADWLDVEQILK